MSRGLPGSFNKADYLGTPGSFVQMKESQGDRQVKPPWAGTSWVEVSYPVSVLLFRLVGVAADEEIEFRGCRLQVQFLQVMQYVEAGTARLHYRRQWQFSSPGLSIDVPSHRKYRGNGFQRGQNLGRAYVSGVQDELHTL